MEVWFLWVALSGNPEPRIVGPFQSETECKQMYEPVTKMYEALKWPYLMRCRKEREDVYAGRIHQ